MAPAPMLFLRTCASALSLCVPFATEQTPSDALKHVTHDSTLTFVRNDGSCLRGTILKTDAATITVEPFKQPAVTLSRGDLAQVSQGDALLYSGRSSWNDVTQAHVYPREALVVILKSGRKFTGHPKKVASDSLTLQHGLLTTTFAKSEIEIIDYLRLRPETDTFDFVLEEAPYALIFYPEFYARTIGLEGRVPVRLYDASKPEDDRHTGIKVCPNS